MRKCFNIDGLCYSEDNYIVDITERINEIKNLIDNKKYFVMNRARQYGKTTTIHRLVQELQGEYTVFSISFEGIGDGAYVDEYAFCRRICGLLYDTMYYGEVKGISDLIREECYQMSLENGKNIDFRMLSNFISKLCVEAESPVVLIIDEVDQASNQEMFLAFLGMLRDKYLKRKNRPTFQSVILAGVYDIKNLKLKIRQGEEHQYNSPWNIAAKFSVDMSFSEKDIAGMLGEYEKDYKTGMDVEEISHMIYDYTSGYPFLVSYICKVIDEEKMEWTKNSVADAVKKLLKEPNTLFDDMIKHLSEYPELSGMLQNILFNGQSYPFNAYNNIINIGVMFGFLAERNGNVCIANRVFEMHMYNYFISEEISKSQDSRIVPPDKNQFVKDGFLDMDLVMEKFMEHYTEVYRECEEKFLEENGRRLFLLYLKPIINGTGNYYIEAQTRNQRRTDIVVDYRGRQYIIEMKIYHGQEYNAKGEQQLADYLDSYHLQRGYLLSFNFNKNKKCGKKEIIYQGKTIVEIVV